MGHSRSTLLGTALILATVFPAAAQQRRSVIRGTVVTVEKLEPIANARVALIGVGRHARTDAQGVFVFDSLVEGTYLVHVRGSDDETPMTEVIVGKRDTVELEVKLGKSAVLILPELATTVAAPADPRYDIEGTRLPAEFLERKGRGIGQFITRDEILRRRPLRFTDLFRNMHGMSLTCRGSTCIPRSLRAPRGCTPIVVVDRMSTDVGVLNGMLPQEVEAVEVYGGAATVPGDYLTSRDKPQCGMIVIWTRVPPQRRPGS